MATTQRDGASTELSVQVATMGEAVGDEEPSVLTLLKTAGASTLLCSETSAITRDSGTVTADGHSMGGHESSAVMMLQAASNVMNSTSATAVVLSSGRTESNEVVDSMNIDQNNQASAREGKWHRSSSLLLHNAYY